MSCLKKVHILLIIVPLAFVTFSNSMRAENPALYGRVWIVVPSGRGPLAEAEVKIVSHDKAETVKKHTPIPRVIMLSTTLSQDNIFW